MELGTVRALRGPNLYGRCTALEISLELAESDLPTSEIESFLSRLRARIPSLAAFESPKTGPETLAVALERVMLALEVQAGCQVSFGRTVAMAKPGSFKVVVEYGEEDSGRKALELARELVDAALADRTFEVGPAVAQLRSLDEDVRLGPSTGSIVRAAQKRGIPIRRLNTGSLVQMGWGSHQHRILAAETDRTSAIGESIAQDKELTKTLLRSVGVPVPTGRPAESAEEAWEIAQDIGLPVVVKPQYGNQGRGVAVNLNSKEQVLAAYEAARQEGSSILVERFAPGGDHRILVVGGKVVAAARREPPQIVGDGIHTVEQLVAMVNADPRRGQDHATSLSKIRLDAIGLAVLAEQGYTPASIPTSGTVVVLRRNANLSTGGSAEDVTDCVHPDVAARAVDAAKVIGLDIAGVDVVCRDVGVPLEEQSGVIVEVNAAPGFRMHLEPSSGKSRPVGEAVVGTMFPEDDNGRIPVVAVTGTNGKTTTTRLIAQILRTDGKRVGMTCTDGIYLDDRRVDTGDCSGPKSARAVLLNPQVDAAVLETARGGMLREGLGFDQCQVAIVTNVGAGDHLGMGGIETVEQLAAVKRIIVENVAADGAAVLNAADPLTAAMASHCPGSVIFFARNPALPLIVSRRAQGGRVVLEKDGAIVVAQGNWERKVADLAQVPVTLGGKVPFQIENALAAVAAAWELGVPWEVIRAGLTSFVNDQRRAPGRFNLVKHGGATLIMDYGHNPDALLALVAAIEQIPHRRRLAVFSCAGDRRDADIVRQAEIVGASFDDVVLYEDACNRGRADGEVTALMRKGIAGAKRARNVVEMKGEYKAIESVLARLQPDDLALIQVDQVEQSLQFINQYLVQHPAAELPPVGQPQSGGRRLRTVG